MGTLLLHQLYLKKNVSLTFQYVHYNHISKQLYGACT